MLMDAAKLSEVIRNKKKKRDEGVDLQVGSTSPVPDMNAQDVYDKSQQGRIESTIDAPEKINADDTMNNDMYMGVGLSEEEKKRMARLRNYMDGIDLA
jgi:hypothetical protein